MPWIPPDNWPATVDGLDPEELLALQVRARTELRRCGSMRTFTGLPCLRHPRPGYPTCWRHGANIPTTINKAERLLAEARIPAIKALNDILDQCAENECEACGYPKGDTDYKRMVTQTAKAVLDRTGMGPRSTIDVNAKRPDDVDSLIERMTPNEREKLRGLVHQLNELKAQVRGRLSPVATIEGEVVSSVVQDPTAK